MNPNNNMSHFPVDENNRSIRTLDRIDWSILINNPPRQIYMVNWSVISANPNAIIIIGDVNSNSMPNGTTVYEQTSEHDTFYCSIKLDEIQNGEFVMIINNCQHRFHAESLRGWLQRKNNCPLCRGSLVDTP